MAHLPPPKCRVAAWTALGLAATLAGCGGAGAVRHAARALGPDPPPPNLEIRTESLLPAHSSLAAYLGTLGLNPAAVGAMVAAARPVFNLNRVQAGHTLDLVRRGPEPVELTYQVDASRELWLHNSNGRWGGEVRDTEFDVQVAAISGAVADSLFAAVERAGETDALALSLAGIFGWDLDFYTDPQPGDSFRVLVEKKYRKGKFFGYGNVLAAEYDNAGRRLQALRFDDGGGDGAGYYHADGTPMKRAFLHSPLKFAARVSSGFSLSRFHPILKTYRAHLGTDYAAPEGTPVQAIGGGVVVQAGNFGGDGNMVRLRHSGGYETMYLHLSRILVKDGQHVAQGDRIGLVGMTGLATGPHLDFRISHDGVFEDFEVLARHLPPAATVSGAARAEFERVREERLPRLEALHPGGGATP